MAPASLPSSPLDTMSKRPVGACLQLDALLWGFVASVQGIPSGSAADTPWASLCLVNCSKAADVAPGPAAHTSLPGKLIILMVCDFLTVAVLIGSLGRWLEKERESVSNHSDCGEL